MNDESDRWIPHLAGAAGAAASEPKLAELSIDCSHVVEMLGEYADGFLGSLAQTRLEFHFSICPACAQITAEYFEVIRLAGMLPGLEPPANLTARLRTPDQGSLKTYPQ